MSTIKSASHLFVAYFSSHKTRNSEGDFMKKQVYKTFIMGMICFTLCGCGQTEPQRAEVNKAEIEESESNDTVYPEYDSISSYTEGMAYFCIDGKYGYVDETGAMVIEPIYHDAGYVKDGRAVVSIGSRYGVIDTEGQEIIPIAYDYVTYDDGCFIVLQDEEIYYYDRNGEITQEPTERTDDSTVSGEGILQNEITQNKEDFWQLTQEKQPGFEELDKQYFRYYEIDGTVMLYYYAEPADWEGMPFSESALYVDNGTEVVEILSAAECGGSSGGNYICFYRDAETDEVLIGTKGHAGGFGGWAGDGSVYRYQDGELEEIFSYMCIEQTPYNYEEKTLIQNAHFFYDENGEPCTPETILEGAYITEYIINGENVTREEYEKACTRYKTCYRTLE